MLVSEVFEDAADLLDKPGGWTQDAMARDALGNSVAILSNDASCFCAYGALKRVTGVGRYEYNVLLSDTMHFWKTNVPYEITAFNDFHSKNADMVVEKFKQLAKKAHSLGK